MIKVVHVRWIDTAQFNGWKTGDQFKRIARKALYEIDTVGFLAYSSMKKIVVIHSIGGDEVTGVIEIPRRCIRKIKTLCQLPISLELD